MSVSDLPQKMFTRAAGKSVFLPYIDEIIVGKLWLSINYFIQSICALNSYRK